MGKSWRRAPTCPWMKLGSSGGAYCIYKSLGTGAAALELARYTFFDQWLVDEETKSLTDNFNGPLDKTCSPDACTRLLPKIADALHS